MEITKYYKVYVESNSDNPYHPMILGSKAGILEAEINKPCCFCYYVEDDIYCPWHRVITSTILNKSLFKDKLEVLTENSLYTFEYMGRQDEE